MSLTLPIRNLSMTSLFLAGFSALGLGGCIFDNSSLDSEPAPIPAVSKKAMVFALNSDYKTGSFSVYGIDSATVTQDVETIHSDAVVRYLGGNDIFILNRLGRDNLQVVDRNNLKTVMQASFPALSNPYDIALKDSLLYVAFLGSAKIGIYRQSDGTSQGEIDLAAYADTSDHLPETTKLMFIGKTLYALLGNLDTKHGYIPLQARLVKIDVAAKMVTASLDLPFGNPASLAYDPVSERIYIPCLGVLFDENYSLVLDGGIVGVDLADFAVADTLVTEADLGGSLNSALYHQGRLIMDRSDTGMVPMESILSIPLNQDPVETLVRMDGYQVGGMDIDSTGHALYIGDRTLGLRVFDLETGKERTETNIKLSNALPIVDLAVIR